MVYRSYEKLWVGQQAWIILNIRLHCHSASSSVFRVLCCGCHRHIPTSQPSNHHISCENGNVPKQKPRKTLPNCNLFHKNVSNIFILHNEKHIIALYTYVRIQYHIYISRWNCSPYESQAPKNVWRDVAVILIIDLTARTGIFHTWQAVVGRSGHWLGAHQTGHKSDTGMGEWMEMDMNGLSYKDFSMFFSVLPEFCLFGWWCFGGCSMIKENRKSNLWSLCGVGSFFWRFGPLQVNHV